MFGSAILQVTIGIFFVYFLLSLICIAVQEAVAALFRLRALTLRSGITKLLGPDITKYIYVHPLIGATKGYLPNYITPSTFALALCDTLLYISKAPHPVEDPTRSMDPAFERLVNAIDRSPDSQLQQMMRPLVETAGGDLALLRSNVENWYQDAMLRIAGRYKTRVHVIIFFIAALVTTALNADTITLTNRLWDEPRQEAQIVGNIQTQQPKSPLIDTSPGNTTLNSNQSHIANPTEDERLLGWTRPEYDQISGIWRFHFNQAAGKILGLFLTTIAVSLIAPFCFDLLSKVSNIRFGDRQPEVVVKDI